MNNPTAYWNIPVDELLKKYDSTIQGIGNEEAQKRKKETTATAPQSPFLTDLFLLLEQFKSPLVLILIFAVILSSALGEFSNMFIILSIILLSGLLGFWQERKANHALQKLRAMVQVNTTVLRSGIQKNIPSMDVVPGDIVMLNAGDIIPGDAVVIEENDLHINEAALTGESFPAEKSPGIRPADTPLNKRKNCVFEGTSVVNGTAKILIVYTGAQTEFGKISKELEKHEPETAFEKGVKKFGYMILRITLLFSLFILILNIFLSKPIADSILFALALAVGMTPELLPAIVTITLSAGAKRMVEKKVIVKKLSSIQNLGAVNIFCSDKTGTLTEGIVNVQSTVDVAGNHWEKVKTFAYLNAKFETGFTNPLDEAIRRLDANVDDYRKIDEVPYDFIRKRLSIVVAFQDKHFLITKGALKNILDVCDAVAFENGEAVPLDQVKDQIFKTQEKYSAQGFRTIGVCYKDITGDPIINKDDETNMIFLGLVFLSDTIKSDIAETVRELHDSGVALKIITGDSQLVALYVSSKIGLKSHNILTGSDLRKMTDEALVIKVNEVDVFAETEPDQKERLVRAMQKAGNVVGYIGDGINDASALKAADVGISVDTAVDVAKETADIVLLDKDLKVLREGIYEGRRTFINTLKYIFVTTSANFGNMFSVAAASLFLPFLPLLPKQILLLNLLSDLPAMAISTDHVDSELLTKPRKWDTVLIRNFMIVFGIESSLFDLLTFSVLLWYFKANESLFQTGWFIESVATEVLILLVIRTQRPFFKSKPGKYLLYAVLLVGSVTIVLPYLPYSDFLSLSPLPIKMIVAMALIAITYSIVTELTKQFFFKRIKF